MRVIGSIRRAFDPRTLRGRLTLAYATALIVGLLAFALGAYAVLKSIEGTSLDAQLGTAARALAAIVEAKDGKISLESNDRAQFYSILGLRLNGAVVARDGDTILSNVANVPTEVRSPGFARKVVHFETLGNGDDNIRVAAVPLLDRGVVLGSVVTWQPIEWFAQLDRWLVLGTLVTMIVIVVPAIGAGALIAARGLRPLEQIADVASEIEARDLALRLDDVPNPRDELGRLSITFNRMLDRLETAFDRERRFTADASHELRAPLAVIAAETTLALRRERTAQEYRATLRTIVDVIAEIETLTESLLAAARSDAGVTVDEPIELKALVASVVERVAPLALERGVKLGQYAEAGVRISAERTSLARALLAILHNALKFAPSGGEVRIEVIRNRSSAVVTIGDDGPGFSHEALAHALERFWRADPARSPGSGAGLGLAIARTIVERTSGTIALANRPTGGALVELRFPVLVP